MKVNMTIALLLMFVFIGIATAQEGAAGKAIFTPKCGICHGADASGNTSIGKNLKIKDLHSPEVQNVSDADLKAIIINGKNKMPAFKAKLTDVQIDQVLAYIREIGKGK